MIVVNIMGGLGNQLFEYAAGRSVSDRINTLLLLDLSLLDASFDQETPREYELGAFRIEAEIASPDQLKKYFRYRHNITPMRYLANRYTRAKYNRARFKEKNPYVYDPRVKMLGDSTYLSGNFISYRYFQHLRPLLLNEIQLKNPLTADADADLRLIRDAGNSVAIHCRLGDYLTKQALYPACGPDYYRAAVKHIEQTVERPRFFVFSDDIEAVLKSRLFDRSDFTLMPTRSPAVDLMLMKACRHQVIANSTYSWWAAWLNDYADKIVVAPRIWLADNANFEANQSLLPPEWIRL